ncbi:MAG: type II toxin-antitoxin system prevent-host-death family antitoxin [Pseudonocardia sp.]|nr:type II toxin-antitoxin system prevent-host-death family antitoxin [Pseudonocardia sp.]
MRDSLSKQLAAVREGRTITVTDHGHPIARLVPVDAPTRLEQLRADGRVRPAQRRKRPAPDPVPVDGAVGDLVANQRR